jgi:prepilin-type N-terminal cleavage/methylation domain-containing protein
MKIGKKKKIQSRRNKKGFTLIELMMVSAIAPMFIISIYLVLDLASVIFRTDSIYSQLNQSSLQNIRHFSREISQTSPLASPGHSVVAFQIPVDWDNDGDVIQDGTSHITEWGAYNQAGEIQNGILGAWVQYSVVNNQIVRELLDSNLLPIGGSSRVITDNLTSFTVTQNQDRVQVDIRVQRTDSTGQSGASRVIQQSFANQVFMRNIVN